MKETYISAELEIVAFGSDDVITTSIRLEEDEMEILSIN